MSNIFLRTSKNANVQANLNRLQKKQNKKKKTFGYLDAQGFGMQTARLRPLRGIPYGEKPVTEVSESCDLQKFRV